MRAQRRPSAVFVAVGLCGSLVSGYSTTLHCGHTTTSRQRSCSSRQPAGGIQPFMSHGDFHCPNLSLGASKRPQASDGRALVSPLLSPPPRAIVKSLNRIKRGTKTLRRELEESEEVRGEIVNQVVEQLLDVDKNLNLVSLKQHAAPSLSILKHAARHFTPDLQAMMKSGLSSSVGHILPGAIYYAQHADRVVEAVAQAGSDELHCCTSALCHTVAAVLTCVSNVA